MAKNKGKLSITELRVQSFVTRVQDPASMRGGAIGVVRVTEAPPQGNCITAVEQSTCCPPEKEIGFLN